MFPKLYLIFPTYGCIWLHIVTYVAVRVHMVSLIFPSWSPSHDNMCNTGYMWFSSSYLQSPHTVTTCSDSQANYSHV